MKRHQHCHNHKFLTHQTPSALSQPQIYHKPNAISTVTTTNFPHTKSQQHCHNHKFPTHQTPSALPQPKISHTPNANSTVTTTNFPHTKSQQHCHNHKFPTHQHGQNFTGYGTQRITKRILYSVGVRREVERYIVMDKCIHCHR